MTQLVLVGAGHAHALVLQGWARAPLPGVTLVLVSPTVFAPYSGMVPGWLAGRYRFHEIGIDFKALAAAAGAQLVCDELWALDPQRRLIRLASGAEIGYDALSLNIGSTLTPPELPGVLALRPLSLLRARWDLVLQQAQHDGDDRPWAVTAVGGGAAGFESLLAALARLRGGPARRRVTATLFSRDSRLLPGLAPAAVRAASAALGRAGVGLRLGTAWQPHQGHDSELLLWATGAQAHAWQRDPARRGALAVSERGFIRVDRQLRSVSHPQIFAAGDCAEWVADATPLPKAGVYAVRMGPVLLHNLRAALGQGLPRDYVPQRRFLALLATGDGRAIASRGGLGLEGRWVWRWKDHIDRGFVRQFTNPQRIQDPPDAG